MSRRQYALCAVWLTAAFASADDIPQLGWRLDGSAFLRLGEGIETPFTRWNRPSAQGTLRVLFLANASAANDVPELARRTDIAVAGQPADTWLRLGGSYWLGMWIATSTHTERAGCLARSLEGDYDVIVLGNFRFLSLPESVQLAILRKVHNGCGLVLFYTHDIDPRLRQIPLPEVPSHLGIGTPFAGLDFYRNVFMIRHGLVWPEEIGPKLFRAWQFGRGRVLEVDYALQSSVFDAVSGCLVPFERYDYTAPVRYDYHQSLAARAVAWAGRHDPDLVWSRPLPDGMEQRARVPGAVSVHALWQGGETTLAHRVRIRNRWGDVLSDTTQALPIAPGDVQWNVALPALPAGIHFVDQILSSERGVENWSSFSVFVRAPLAISTLETTGEFFDTGKDVTGRALLSRPVRDEKVDLRLVLEDGYGRLFSEHRVSVPSGEDRVAFAVSQGQLVAWGARLRAQLRIDGQAVDLAETEVRFRRPSRGEYPIAMWGAVDGYGNHVGNVQMRNLGFTAVLDRPPIDHARDDLGWMTFGGGVGALIHSLGDELSIPRPGKGDNLAAFLEKRYPTLDALNRAWETTYASWLDVEPCYTVQDGSPASFVRYHDSRACGEWLYAENCRRQREEIEQHNPSGVVGPEGSPVGDPELTLPAVTFWGPYLTVRDNLLVNALGRPGLLRGNWFGGYVEDRQVPTRLRHVLWLSILGGNNMIEYFSIRDGLLAPDLSLMPFTEEFLPSWNELRRGLGPLLAKCRPAGNPVALLHSQASEHVGDAGGPWTSTIQAHEYLLNLLGDAGYSPQYVATGQVQRGRLEQGDIRVLFLVHAFALGDDEIAAIQAFAERGGTVIADMIPAWFDNRLFLRAERGMDRLFGLPPSTPRASLRDRLVLMQKTRRVRLGDHSLLLRGGDPTLPGTDRIAMAPAGRGRYMLLNGTIWKEGREDPDTIAAVRNLLFDEAETPPAFRFHFEPPLNKVGTKVYSFVRGPIWIDAILPPEATDPALPVVPSIEWEGMRYVYDLRQEQYLGVLDQLALPVDRATPLVVARLPYRVANVRIEAETRVRVGETARLMSSVFDARERALVGHVLRLSVQDPRGRDCPYYGAILDGEGPQYPWQVPFAHNDPTGVWTVTATDVISGTTASVSITLFGSDVLAP